MYTVIKAFSIYLDGINPTRFEEGQQDLPDRAAEVALSEGWAVAGEPVAESANVEESPVEESQPTPAPKGRGKK